MAVLLAATILLASGCASVRDRTGVTVFSQGERELTTDDLKRHARAESERQGVPWAFTFAIIETEVGGGWDCVRLRVGRAGEIGCGQIKRATWGDRVGCLGPGADILNPLNNLTGAVCQISWIRKSLGPADIAGGARMGLQESDLWAAAYNGGRGHLVRSISGQEQLGDTVLRYIAQVREIYGRYAAVAVAVSE